MPAANKQLFFVQSSYLGAENLTSAFTREGGVSSPRAPLLLFVQSGARRTYAST
jgi:hypothetical protein